MKIRLSRNTKGTLAFLSIVAVAQIFVAFICAAAGVFWGTPPCGFIVAVGFLIGDGVGACVAAETY